MGVIDTTPCRQLLECTDIFVAFVLCLIRPYEEIQFMEVHACSSSDTDLTYRTIRKRISHRPIVPSLRSLRSVATTVSNRLLPVATEDLRRFPGGAFGTSSLERQVRTETRCRSRGFVLCILWRHGWLVDVGWLFWFSLVWLSCFLRFFSVLLGAGRMGSDMVGCASCGGRACDEIPGGMRVLHVRGLPAGKPVAKYVLRRFADVVFAIASLLV